MTSLDEALAFALELATLGGNVAQSHYQKAPSLRRKPDGTWVTEADLAAEATVREAIAKRFPNHNVLGEEQGFTSSGGGAPVDGAPTWIVDPIDGTHNYMAGIPIWATLVALQLDGEFALGVAHAPALGETYEAALGHGARMNGNPIAAADVGSLEEATTLFGGGIHEGAAGAFVEELVARSWRIRGFGDFWGHMLVARGAAHVMFEPELSIWDAAALVPIVTEAGGKLTHLDGSPWRERGTCLTTCASLHAEVVALGRAGS
jgi:histidinol-phosphatase